MKGIINILLLAFVIIGIVCEPLFIINNMNTILGKIITVIVIVSATMYNTVAGLLLALLFVCFRMKYIEGMENGINDDKDDNSSEDEESEEDDEDEETEEESEDDEVNSGDGNNADDEKSDSDDEDNHSIEKILSVFRKKNCKNGDLINSDGDKINMKDIKKHFPDISFSGKICNPCDPSCKFEITSSNERITNEENIRPKSSNELPVTKTSKTDENDNVKPHDK